MILLGMDIILNRSDRHTTLHSVTNSEAQNVEAQRIFRILMSVRMELEQLLASNHYKQVLYPVRIVVDFNYEREQLQALGNEKTRSGTRALLASEIESSLECAR